MKHPLPLLKKANPQRASKLHYEDSGNCLGKIVQELHLKRGKRYYCSLSHPNLDPEQALGKFIYAFTEHVNSWLQNLYGSGKSISDNLRAIGLAYTDDDQAKLLLRKKFVL